MPRHFFFGHNRLLPEKKYCDYQGEFNCMASSVLTQLQRDAAHQMKNVQSKCRLCAEVAELRGSHFIPAAIYKNFIETGRHPIFITRENSFETAKQVQDLLLCAECEQLLHRKGEDWTLAHYCKGLDEFPLQKLLQSVRPSVEFDSGAVIKAQEVPDINIYALAHFAIGVFWKASAHTWYFNRRALRRSPLGPYEIKFGKYLQGFAEFPKEAVLKIFVSKKKEPRLVCCPPYCSKKEGHHIHSFTIPGITFRLNVGKSISLRDRRLCSLSSVGQPVYFVDTVDEVCDRISLQMSGLRKPVGKLCQLRNVSP